MTRRGAIVNIAMPPTAPVPSYAQIAVWGANLRTRAWRASPTQPPALDFRSIWCRSKSTAAARPVRPPEGLERMLQPPGEHFSRSARSARGISSLGLLGRLAVALVALAIVWPLIAVVTG